MCDPEPTAIRIEILSSSFCSCPFLVKHLTGCIPVIGGALFVFVVITLLQTSFSDPGILPRATPDEAADIEKQIGRNQTFRISAKFSGFAFLFLFYLELIEVINIENRFILMQNHPLHYCYQEKTLFLSLSYFFLIHICSGCPSWRREIYTVTTSASILGYMCIVFFHPSKTPTHDQSLESDDVRGSCDLTTRRFVAIFEMETLTGPITYSPGALTPVLADTWRLVQSGDTPPAAPTVWWLFLRPKQLKFCKRNKNMLTFANQSMFLHGEG